MLNKKFYKLLGFEGSVLDLSNKLVALGCEDICEFGNWDEILDDKNVIVAMDECGDKHIQIYFDVTITSGEDEIVTASNVKITDFEFI